MTERPIVDVVQLRTTIPYMFRSLAPYPRVAISRPPLLQRLVSSVRARVREAFTLCRCTHPRVLHTHYSRSEICAGCTCTRWRREFGRGWKIS